MIKNVKKLMNLLFVPAILLTSGFSFSQEQNATFQQNSPLPFDNEVKVGTLPNGFKYFIRKNVEPKDRVTMYLAVKVGSVLETEAQRGLAHFLEHMNFNGLKHFPKNALVDYLQKSGVRFGSDLNAFTSFEQTVYQLPIPSDDPEILKNGLQIMRDWSQDALLTSEEIDKERGIVMEEMRGGRGAGQRMRDQFFPIIFNGSIFSERLPIGTEKVVTTFPHSEIRKFHKDWYRPELQSIIVVGDIDVNYIEKEIVRLFSDMKIHPNPPKHIQHKVPLINKNQFKAVTDPEMTSTVFQIFIKHPEEKIKTFGDYRKQLIRGLYSQMLNNRLSELQKQADPPFLSSRVGIGNFIGGIDTYNISIGAKPNEHERGFKAVIREIERAKRFGFTQTEFDRAVSVYSKYNEIQYKERDKNKSDVYVERYMNHFLEDAPALSDEDGYQITKQLLPTLTLAEVDAISKKYYTDINRDVIILAPEKDKNSLPDESKVNSWLKDIENEKLTAYVDNVSDKPLLSKQPKKGSIVSEKNIPSVGATEFTLSNGVKVLLKTTNFKNDEILMNGSSKGGTSLYADNDYFNASYASNLVGASGLGQYNSIELKKYLTGKNLSVSAGISETGEYIYGNTDKEGLDTFFELTYAYFTETKIEDDIFKGIIANRISSLANQALDPSYHFQRDMQKKLYNDNIRRRSITENDLKQINKDRALQIFQERFADADDFYFVFVGSITKEELKPYLENYLAALPSVKTKENFKKLNILEPKQGLKSITKKGQEDKVNIILQYINDYKQSDYNDLVMSALSSTLSIKLLEKIREEEGGVYGIGARSSTSKFPYQRSNFMIRFGTSIGRYEKLIEQVYEEVDKVIKNGPTQEDLEKFKIEQKRQLELSVKDNEYWHYHLVNTIYNGDKLEDPSNFIKLLDKLSVKDVQKMTKKHLKKENLFEFILIPEQVK